MQTQLKLGIMTMRELSVWFGLQPDAISKGSKSAKEKKLQKLKLFCDYHMEGKKVFIDRIMIPEYTKAFDVFETNFDKEWGYIVDANTHELSWQHKERIDTCTRVAMAIQYKHPEAKQVAESTAAGYVSKIKTSLYGRTYQGNAGSKGTCHIVYLNRDKTGLLSEEDMAILVRCREEAYKDVNEQRYKLDEAYMIKEITKQEWKEAIGEIDTSAAYDSFQNLLLKELGFIPTRRTQLVEK